MPEAVTHRVAIWDYLEGRNPQAAVRMDQQFSATADRLTDFSERGSPGIVPDTRKLVPGRELPAGL
ncbi:type II toxin-antitoxin system RelE/ParE family toxin [Halomonas sp.]|uniref:type II toxin-antitoxin system RelE/ParE family toxin n=1 Tax=Halomonas sp. TaxID=1486246 RepID=UPI00298E6592|nr:type II toxin-antitoxin system RelE/ParE family toxin [Halomonas sp.]MDW7748261.1 type II toxin-antitoxin system RelE/ParE family toxin [Halomonas sp.]